MQFPRVWFARSKRFKLYARSRFHYGSDDWEEKQPLTKTGHLPGANETNVRLRRVQNSMPTRKPNNAAIQ